MTSVLLSVSSMYCDNIARGNKKFVVTKTRPKIDTTFKVYVYHTVTRDAGVDINHWCDGWFLPNEEFVYAGGKVVCEFVCDQIIQITDYSKISSNLLSESCCWSLEELQKYGKGKPLYFWHVSNPKMYDKLKDLSEFYKPCKWYEKEDGCGDSDCPLCVTLSYEYGKISFDCEGQKPLTRAPKSWCYVKKCENLTHNE